MDTWLADTSTCEGAASFGIRGQRGRPRRQPDAERSSLESSARMQPAADRQAPLLPGWSGCCSSSTMYSLSVLGVRLCLAQPCKSSATALPCLEMPVGTAGARLRCSRGGTEDGQECTPCRRSASFAFASFPLPSLAQRQRQRRARSSLHLAIGRSKPASHQPAESPSFQVPSPSLSCTPSMSQAQPQRTHQPVSGWS